MTHRNLNWIDISVEIFDGMPHYPGDPDVVVKKEKSLETGDDYNLTTLSFSAHTATHIDTPHHFINKGYDAASIRLERMIGQARVIEIRNKSIIEISDIEDKLQDYSRILFKTDNSEEEWWRQEINLNHCFLSTEAAELLRIKKISCVGIDYYTIGGKDNDERVHKILLDSDILIIEGLNLALIGEGDYEMICLPLKIKNSDGAPARILLRAL